MASQRPRASSVEQLYNFPAKLIFVPALKAGILTGTAGLLTGGVQAILRSSPTPTLFAIASGLQCFALGSTFWATRSTLLYTTYPNATPSDRLSASSYAGGTTGGLVGGILRGRRNVIPGTIMFTLFGFLGQTVYNRLDARHSEQVALEVETAKEGKEKGERGFWDRFAEMKWSPLKTLTDEEYRDILREKLLRVDAEIALLDEQVERLRGEEIRVTEKRPDEPSIEEKSRR